MTNPTRISDCDSNTKQLKRSEIKDKHICNLDTLKTLKFKMAAAQKEKRPHIKAVRKPEAHCAEFTQKHHQIIHTQKHSELVNLPIINQLLKTILFK